MNSTNAKQYPSTRIHSGALNEDFDISEWPKKETLSGVDQEELVEAKNLVTMKKYQVLCTMKNCKQICY